MTTQPELSHELCKLDATIISSLLQKSIRRGELIVAQCAALTLLMRRDLPSGGACWSSHLRMSVWETPIS